MPTTYVISFWFLSYKVENKGDKKLDGRLKGEKIDTSK